MVWFVLFLLVLICFGGVLLFGAPYLPTLAPQAKVALELADLQAGQTLLELGSGDGKILLTAAQQGIRVVGYELNPLLVVLSWLRTRKYRQLVTIIWGDFWHKPWPEAEAIFVFLLPKYMKKLDTKIIQYPHKPVKLVSFAFTIPEKRPSQQKAGIYLYKYTSG